MNHKIYQLSLERKPGRFTDKEWPAELKMRQRRNAALRVKYRMLGWL